MLVNIAGKALFGTSDELTAELVDGLPASNVRAPLQLVVGGHDRDRAGLTKSTVARDFAPLVLGGRR